MRYAFLMLILAGCGSAHIDPEFLPHLQTFQRLLNDNHINKPTQNISIEFGDTGGASGLCVRSAFQPNHIYISSNDWTSMADVPGYREILIFHELGHCALDREHDEVMLSSDSGEMAESIMNPIVNRARQAWLIPEFRKYYEQELLKDVQRISY